MLALVLGCAVLAAVLWNFDLQAVKAALARAGFGAPADGTEPG